jgi:type IV secretory pathway VirB10-like protein
LPLHPAVSALLDPPRPPAPPARTSFPGDPFAPSRPPPLPAAGAPEKALLGGIVGEYAAAERRAAETRAAEERRREEAHAANERRQQEEREKRLREQALKFLGGLDPYSNEGMWFTEFARRFPTPVAAAMEYLVAVKGL